MFPEILLNLALAAIAAGLYMVLSEEVPRLLAAIVMITCLFICLVIAPWPLQLLIFLGVLYMNPGWPSAEKYY